MTKLRLHWSNYKSTGTAPYDSRSVWFPGGFHLYVVAHEHPERPIVQKSPTVRK